MVYFIVLIAHLLLLAIKAALVPGAIQLNLNRNTIFLMRITFAEGDSGYHGCEIWV